MKILSPAGNLDALKMAVNYGADEVYLGINDFNARNNIDGFTLDNLQTAVDYAHVRGVKVLLAINILFTDFELQSAVDTVVDAFNLGVDAFIVQDLGLAKILNDNFPQIELHASTQMALHNLEGVKAVLKYGFKRVVLSRETPLDEIKRIKDNVDVEIEYFAHGALCVSFSGNCYLSSYMLGASGNRGRCKQLCRLPYSLSHNGKFVKKGYLLSAKDFDTVERLTDLKDSGVDVLKIEGRARRPYYVGVVTREYYKALNGQRTDKTALKLAFNRGFTQGYFNGNGDIISEIQNHVGINVGSVYKVNKGKTFTEFFINSNRVLSSKSTFKLFDLKEERCTLTAYDLVDLGGGRYRLTTTQPVKVGDKINLIIDYFDEKTVLSKTARASVLFEGEFLENKPAKILAKFGNKEVVVNGAVCLPAQKQPLSEGDVIDNFSKSEDFYAKFTSLKIDKVFLPKSTLNEFRRNTYQALFDLVTKNFRKSVEKVKIPTIAKINSFKDFEFTDSVNYIPSSKNVIYSPEIYSLSNFKEFCDKCKNLGKKPYLDTPNFASKKDIELLIQIVNETGIGVVANNYYALGLSSDTIIGGGLNVFNSVTAKTLDKPVITAELDTESKVIYPYMTLRHCPMKSHVGGDCANCLYDDCYTYKMDNGKVLKLRRKKISTCTFYLTD